MKEQQALDAMAALSQETRLRIIRLLVKAGKDGAAAGDIGLSVGASSSRLSFHLASLEHAGLVNSVRISRNIIYRVSFDRLGGLINYLLVDCCGDNADVRACCS